MAEIEIEAEAGNDRGVLSRHPLRTAGTAFLAGAMLASSISKARKDRRSNMQKLRDQLNDII